jgi:putative membrane protein
VRQFGQRMIDDHTKANDDLKGVATKYAITLPTDLDARHRAIVTRFSNMSGTAFDRAYMRDMVRDHQSDIADFEREANNGVNSDLKNWAAATLPTLRDHLRMAKNTDTSLGVTSRR